MCSWPELIFEQVATRGILKYVVRGMLGDRQRESLVLFMDAIAALCVPYQDASRIPVLKEQVDVALAHVERDFPLSLQVKDPYCTSIKSVLVRLLLILSVATLLEIRLQMCIELAADQKINAFFQ